MSGDTNLVKIPCRRCGGTGHYSYNPIDGTVCFSCRGRKYEIVNPKSIARNDRRRATEDAKRKAAAESIAAINARVDEKLARLYAGDWRQRRLYDIAPEYHHMHYHEWLALDAKTKGRKLSQYYLEREAFIDELLAERGLAE